MSQSLEKALLTEAGLSSIDELPYQNRIWFDYATSTNTKGESTVKTIEAYLKGRSLSGMRVLDIGCGFGGTVIAAAKKGAQVLGVDISERNLLMSKENLKDFQGVDVAFKNIDVTNESNLKELGYFDIIVADNVIEHVKSPSGLISSISSLLKPGGGAYITAPNARSTGMVKAECHYSIPGIALLNPLIAEKVLNQKSIEFQPYDVSFYYDFSQYLEMFYKYGLDTSSLLPEVGTSQEIDTLKSEVKAAVEVVKNYDYKELKDILHEAIDKWLMEFNTDVNFMAREKSEQLKSRVSGKIKRDYGYGLWYFFCTKQ